MSKSNKELAVELTTAYIRANPKIYDEKTKSIKPSISPKDANDAFHKFYEMLSNAPE